jgi:hypothetical protein
VGQQPGHIQTKTEFKPGPIQHRSGSLYWCSRHLGASRALIIGWAASCRRRTLLPLP